MWKQPYLETCCRSALRRVILSGTTGRPDGLKDDRCLRRLHDLGLVSGHSDGRVRATPTGEAADRSWSRGRASPGA